MVAREKTQLIIAIVLIGASISIPIGYILHKGFDDELVKTMVTGLFAIALAGVGAAYSLLGLGRKVTD